MKKAHRILPVFVFIVIGVFLWWNIQKVGINHEINELEQAGNIGEVEKRIDNVTLGNCDRLIDEGYLIELKMFNGVFYNDPNPGAFEGDNWVGNCKLILSADDKILSEYAMDGDWKEALRFQKKFEIQAFDYYSNGEIEFLIGQYGSSNLNEYRLYRITADKKIELVEEAGIINISGKEKYSCLFDISKDGQVSYDYYDNSKGRNVKRVIRFESGTVIIE
jgi:hypothetical protein